jgi:ferrous iron transport protein A
MREEEMEERMTLADAVEGKEYTIKGIDTDDEEMDEFLFRLGCYSGEPITVVSHIHGGCVVAIKDARYNIDRELADAIVI